MNRRTQPMISSAQIYICVHSFGSTSDFSISSSFFRLKPPMQERSIHCVWFISHILRTLVGDQAYSRLADTLQLEVRALQAELHHTQRVLSGYSDILARCQADRPDSHRGQFLFFSFSLLVVIVFIFSIKRYQVATGTPTVGGIGDNGGSSDSELDQHPIPPVLTRSLVPTRPSSLGRGKSSGKSA